jgi:hypothetical protein
LSSDGSLLANEDGKPASANELAGGCGKNESAG